MEAKDDKTLPGRKSAHDLVAISFENVELMNILEDLPIKKNHEAESGQKLNGEIANRKRSAADTAFAAQHPITDERDIVVPADGLEAMAAA